MNSLNNKPRPLCPFCGKRPVAINRYSNNNVYYRKICDSCARARAAGKILKPQPPAWVKSGYKKKPNCEKCGFVAKYPEDQMRVFYLDGDLKNNSWSNLRTICLNCQQEITKSKLTWKPADLVPDF
jgi:hypothetical protein